MLSTTALAEVRLQTKIAASFVAIVFATLAMVVPVATANVAVWFPSLM